MEGKEIPLTEAEELFLTIGYNKFYDLYEEIFTPAFWTELPSYRFSKISQAFAVYSELLAHEPFEHVIKWLEKVRPPMESDIVGPFFKFIRHILVHFPFSETWDEVWINKALVNWRRENQSIDRFLKKYSGHDEVKYRFKEKSKNGFTYVTINFPATYGDERIYLKDMMVEEEGLKFAIVMMRKVLDTQVLSVGPKQ